MRKFDTLVSKAVAMLTPDIDTDVIAPLDSLTSNKSVAQCAFSALRYIDGDMDRCEPNPEFCLNQSINKGAQILLAGENFGCGSSRETAAQSLVDLGFRCVIGSSFGGIFFENCFKQGLLLIELPTRTVEQLADLVSAGEFTVNLKTEVIETPTRERIGFSVNSWRRRSFLEGLDSIDLSLTLIDQIEEFTRRDKAKRPWVYSAAES